MLKPVTSTSGRPLTIQCATHAPDAAAGQDADRVQPGGDEVVAQLGRLADDRLQVGREALRPAEELADADVERDRHAAHRLLDVRPHAIPVGADLAEREVGRDAVDLPRRAHRLEQADHQPADLLAEVAVRARILEHRPRRVEAVDLLGDQVVVLGGLQRDVDARPRAELAGPHAGAVDDVLGLDRPRAVVDAGDRAAMRRDAGDGDALDDRRALLAGASGERHRHVDRVHAAVVGDVEAGEDVVGAGEREHLGDLGGRDLLHVDAAVAVERRDPPVLLEPIRVGGELDEADRLEPGRLPGLGLEPRVQVARVLAHLGRGLRRRAERHHQPGRVPRRAGRELVALEEHDVAPAHVRQVVRDRAADDAATDHDDPGPCRQFGHRGIIPCHGKPTPPPNCLLQTQRRAVWSRQNDSNPRDGPNGADRSASTVGHVDEATLRRLYATVPTDFVAARNAVVKELRRAKERDEAALVAALRRPDWTDWALNVVAAEHADAVGEFATAAGDVRDAQAAAIEGRAGPDVRSALRALRDRTTDVSRKAAAVLERVGRAPGTADLTARLSEIAGHAMTTDQLRLGVLGSGDPDASDPFGGLEPADRPSPRRGAPAQRASPGKRAAAASTKTDQLPRSQPKPSAAERQRIKRDRDRAEQARRSRGSRACRRRRRTREGSRRGRRRPGETRRRRATPCGRDAATGRCRREPGRNGRGARA